MKINKYFQSLLNIPLFSGFTEVELMKALGGRFSTRDFGRNEIIYIQNEKANSMDIILEGKVLAPVSCPWKTT